MKTDKLSLYIYHFLQDYMNHQKGFSRHTILNYRDTIKIFLNFSAMRKKKPVVSLTISDLDQLMVIKFLEYIEEERKNSKQTRNIRLACIHSLFSYIAKQDPLIFDHCHRILAIPFQRVQHSTVEYLEREEVKAILKAIDHSSTEGLRDYTLFYFMYNTGGRVQEIISLKRDAIQLEHPFQARFLGKGAKERICPLWAETVKLFKEYFKQRNMESTGNALIFLNHNGQALTRHGVRYLLKKYVKTATDYCPSLKRKNIHPHTIRHSTATNLLQAGVDINTIRAWLGHESLTTTNRYAEIDLNMKRKVLDKFLPFAKSNRPWKQNHDLVQWLESL